MIEEQEVIERLKLDISAGEYSTTKTEVLETVLSMLKEKDIEIEYQKEKRNNQKAELAILNEKQKEMNKLINIVSSYKGMFKKQQKEMKKKDNTIDLMAEYISKIDIEEDVCMKNKTNPDWCNEDYTKCKDCIKQYFERKSKE